MTGEAAYYHYNVNDGGVSDSLLRARARTPRPTVGVGNIQPMVRYQWAKMKGRGHQPLEHRRRAVLPDQGPGAAPARDLQPHGRPAAHRAPSTANSVQLGAQAIFF